MSHADVLFFPGFVCMVALPAACNGATLVLKQIDIYHVQMQSGAPLTRAVIAVYMVEHAIACTWDAQWTAVSSDTASSMFTPGAPIAHPLCTLCSAAPGKVDLTCDSSYPLPSAESMSS